MSYAIPELFRDVKREFASRGYVCEFKFGWRESAGKNLDGQQSEIAFVPGDDKSWRMGDFEGPGRANGEGSRALAQMGELLTVYVSGIDKARMEEQLAQYEATRRLFNLLFAALYRSAHGNYSILDMTWSQVLERTSGLSVRLLLRVLNPIRDFEDESVIAANVATITATSENSEDEFVSSGDETPP